MKSGPEGPLSLEAAREAASFASRPPQRSAKQVLLLRPQRRQPAPAVPALPVGFGLRLALLRGSCPSAVAGCVVAGRAFAGGRDLAGLGVGLGLRLAVGAGLVRGRRRLRGAAPGLRRPGPACRPCSLRPSRPCAARASRRGSRGLGEGGLREHGERPRRRRRGRVWSSLISPESFQMEREGANMQASRCATQKIRTRHDNASSGDRLTRARAGTCGPAAAHFTDSGFFGPR